jgi:hypothetical protein
MNARKLIEDEADDAKDEVLSALSHAHKIRVSYEIITPESAEHGDADERGWEDEDGASTEPDEYDQQDGLTAVDIAVRFLRECGPLEPSSSQFHSGIWYTNHGESDNGTVTNKSYFLTNFTHEEEWSVWRGVTAPAQFDREQREALEARGQ